MYLAITLFFFRIRTNGVDWREWTGAKKMPIFFFVWFRSNDNVLKINSTGDTPVLCLILSPSYIQYLKRWGRGKVFYGEALKY